MVACQIWTTLVVLGSIVSASAASVGVRRPMKFRVGTSLPPNHIITERQANTTVVVQPGDTLFKLATKFGVGVCDIVKASGIQNPDLVTLGQPLTIPPPTATPDNTSCLPPPAAAATATCVLGGPDRLVIPDGGLAANLAASFLNITLDALAAANTAQFAAAGVTAEQAAATNLTGGSVLSVPVCPGSQCTISQGTVQAGDIFNDIAGRAGSTTGQILALNPGIDRLNLQVGQTFTLASNCHTVDAAAPAPAAGEDAINSTAAAHY